MSPNPAHEPRVAASGTGLDWSILPISLPLGSFSEPGEVELAAASSIGVSLTLALTTKVSAPGASITTILLEPSARRMPEKQLAVAVRRRAARSMPTITLICALAWRSGGCGGTRRRGGGSAPLMRRRRGGRCTDRCFGWPADC